GVQLWFASCSSRPACPSQRKRPCLKKAMAGEEGHFSHSGVGSSSLRRTVHHHSLKTSRDMTSNTMRPEVQHQF
uniref:Uncharacterized protein n=1 Tax=Echeneis naucrates TaxID=173247 RepID=A0A665UKC9_ECHNA